MLTSSSSSEDELSLASLSKRKRIFKPRINFDSIYPSDFKQRYRLREEHVDFLNHRIGHLLRHKTRRNYALSPRQQIIVALRHLATGANFTVVADAHGLHKSTVSRCVHRFVKAVVRTLFAEVVDWPEDPRDVRRMVSRFREIGGMPCVIGCIDGTHIPIARPVENEAQFVNRHGEHSVNAMMVCGADLRFVFCSARWPGSVNDGRVFRNSALAHRLEDGWRPFPACVILGDSGFPNLPYLITPLPNPITVGEQLLNRKHKSTRRLVENSFALLKERFRCLLVPLPFEPTFSCETIKCCVVLHNIVTEPKDAEEEHIFLADPNIEQSEVESDGESDAGEGHRNNVRRRELIAFFDSSN